MQPDSQDKPTVGATLATAREAMGISPIEAADLLNLTQRTIEALEADDYQSLPGRVYVNGYVRAYAKMLGLDADDLIFRSAALHGDADEAPLNDEAKEPAGRHNVNKMPVSLTLKQWGLVAAGLVGLVLLISFFDDIPRPNNQPVDTVRSAAETRVNDVMGALARLSPGWNLLSPDRTSRHWPQRPMKVSAVEHPVWRQLMMSLRSKLARRRLLKELTIPVMSRSKPQK